MTLEELKQSLSQNSPPEGSHTLIQALWQDAQGEWDIAHQLAQSMNTAEGAWVHAYLHRKEGDLSNAAYWYTRAGKPHSKLPLEEEWAQIARALL
jgi:hypothetical protein